MDYDPLSSALDALSNALVGNAEEVRDKLIEEFRAVHPNDQGLATALRTDLERSLSALPLLNSEEDRKRYIVDKGGSVAQAINRLTIEPCNISDYRPSFTPHIFEDKDTLKNLHKVAVSEEEWMRYRGDPSTEGEETEVRWRALDRARDIIEGFKISERQSTELIALCKHIDRRVYQNSMT